MINVSKCKLFLEGVNVPFNSIKIQESIGQPVIAEVSIPATESILKLLPKTLAHIFYSFEGTNYLIFEGEFSAYSFMRASDRREVTLVFKGLMNNWSTAVIASTDIAVGSIKGAQYYVTSGANPKDHTIDANTNPKFVKFYFSSDFNLFSILVALVQNIKNFPKNTFSGIMEQTLFTDLDRCSLYYQHIKNVLRMDASRIFIQENPVASQFMTAQYMREHFANQITGTNYTESLLNILHQIFQYVGYDIVEIGAPVKTGSNLQSILIKPVGDYMMPIKCNTIFTDQILYMNFSRDLDAEPTRITSYCNPIFPQTAKNELDTLIMTVIAPSEIMDNAKKVTEGLQMGMSEEEKYRGVLPRQYTDTTGLDETYLFYCGRQKDGGVKSFFDAKKALSDLKNETAPTMVKYLIDKKNDVLKYHKALADLHYADLRLSSRVFSVGLPYTPFRLVGFPAVVIDRDFPSVIGTVSQITSVISSDGNATQSIALSKARVWWDGITTEGGNGFLSETHTSVPEWFDAKTFGASTIGSKFYNLLIPSQPGVTDTDMAITNVLSAADKQGDDMTVMGKAIATLKKKYLAFPGIAREDFAKRYIFRPLATEGDVWSFLTGNTLKLEEINSIQPVKDSAYRKIADVDVSNLKDPKWKNKPFILERRDRVKEIFNSQLNAVVS